MILCDEEKSIIYMMIDQLTEARDPFFVDGKGIRALARLREKGCISLHPNVDGECIETIVNAFVSFIKDRYFWSPFDIVTSNLETSFKEFLRKY